MRRALVSSAIVSMAVVIAAPAFAVTPGGPPRINGGGTTAEGAQFSVSAKPDDAGAGQDSGHFNYTQGDFKIRQCDILTYEDNPTFDADDSEQFPGAEGAVRITAECRLLVQGGGRDNDRIVFVKAKFADFGEPGGGVDRARIQAADSLDTLLDGRRDNNLDLGVPGLKIDAGRIQAGNVQIVPVP